MSGAAGQRDLAFISYSHADRVWLERLQILLKPYVRKGRLVSWVDPYIAVGTEWKREINAALERTRVGVLLASQNFAASDFIMDVELPALMDAAKRGELTLFCIPVSSVNPELIDLDGYQWARPPNEPLDLLNEPERNRALTEIGLELVRSFARHDVNLGVHPANVGNEPFIPPGLWERPVRGATAKSKARTEAIHEALEDRAPVPHVARRTVEPLSYDAAGSEGALYGVPELPPNFVPRRSELDELRANLFAELQPTFGISGAKRTGVHGQGGIGKTVLATALVRDTEVRRAFPDGIYWITLGQEPSLVALQQALLGMVTPGAPEIESVNLGVVALRKALFGKRCLLVLDDVWRSPDPEAFAALDESGRLLVTTRNQEILTGLGAVKLELEVLSPEDALNVLAKAAGCDAQAMPSAAEEVAKDCGYLPLALAVAGAQIADGLSWASLSEGLRKRKSEFLHHANQDVFASLGASLNALAPDEGKRYVELAIFPEDTAVPEVVIQRLWSAELEPCQSEALLVRLANRALLSRNSEGGETVVRLHDLQGDYLRLVAPELWNVHARLLDISLESLPIAERESTRWAQLPTSETYLWRHLFHHLLGAGQREPIEALVTDVRWLNAKIAALGVSALLTDLAMLVERAPTDDIRRIERALSREAGWLHQHPEALPSLLYNRLRSEGLPTEEIERLMGGVRPPVRLVQPVRFGGGRVFRGHLNQVTACVYSPDGSRILSACHDRTLREWDRASGKELTRFEGHLGNVSACVYSPDGTRVLSASGDRTRREWDRAAGKELTRFEGHLSYVSTCVYSPDGTRVLSASHDNTVKFWCRVTGQCLDTLYGVAGFRCLAAAPGQFVAGDAFGNLWLLDCDWLIEGGE